MDEERTNGIIAMSTHYERMRTLSLVLDAARIPNKLVDSDGGWLLRTHPWLEERARREIATFDAENSSWPPPLSRDDDSLPDKVNPSATFFFFLLLIVFHAITGPWANHASWFMAGAAMKSRVLAGEWWRVVTALSLHADSAHLIGNVIIGGMVIHFLCRTLGAGTSWLLLLAAGALGNTLNLLSRSGEHLSVGFSTAVFGAIGILSGLRIRRAMNARTLLLPLGAGAGLLAFLGTEGEKTDFGAHAFGFFCGIALGVLAGLRPATPAWRKDRPLIIFPFLVLTIFYCWHLAMSNG